MTEDPRWGDTVRGGPGVLRRRLRRVALVGIPALVVLLAAVYGGAGLYASSRIQRVEVEGLTGGSGPHHTLVVGSDSREGLTPEQQRELTTGDVAGQRTDTIFVLSRSGGKAAVLSFPRDLYVTRCDGTEGRINTALQLGGPGCLVRTVADLSGLAIGGYLAVDFLGFRDIVDTVGGVEVCLEAAIRDPFAGVDLPAGCQTLSGREALGYVRTRKIDNDLQRIQRQQRFLRALAGEVLAPATLANPLRVYRLAGRVGGALTADRGLSTLDLLGLARGLRGLAGARAVTHTVPTTPATVGGAAVLRPTEPEAAALFASYRDGSVFDQAPAPPSPKQ